MGIKSPVEVSKPSSNAHLRHGHANVVNTLTLGFSSPTGEVQTPALPSQACWEGKVCLAQHKISAWWSLITARGTLPHHLFMINQNI